MLMFVMVLFFEYRDLTPVFIPGAQLDFEHLSPLQPPLHPLFSPQAHACLYVIPASHREGYVEGRVDCILRDPSDWADPYALCTAAKQ